MFRWLAVLAVLTATPVAHADRQIWTAAFLQARPDPTGITMWADVHGRRRADGLLAIVRPGLGWTFGPALAVHAGYAFVPTLVDEGDDRREQRIWQQVIWSHAQGLAKFQVRGRLEQRFSASGDDLGHRARVFLRAQAAPWAEVPVQLVGWDEIFIGLNETDWRQPQGFDQNRLFLGFGTDTALKGVRVEAGYMNINLRHGPTDHALGVNLLAMLAP